MKEKDKGIWLAASFSWGCQRAKDLGISELLKSFSKSPQNYNSQEIRNSLEKLFSYFYYRVIAQANKVEDPFDEKVVKAHWIGNEFLEKVTLISLRKVVLEFEREGWADKILLAYLAKPVILSSAHHNAYSADNFYCQVFTDGKYFYHLGIKRIKATKEDLNNFEKYGIIKSPK